MGRAGQGEGGKEGQTDRGETDKQARLCTSGLLCRVLCSSWLSCV